MFVADIPVPHEDGSFVNEKVSRIVELIHDYDPNLEVRWIHPKFRDELVDSFQIVEMCKDGVARTVFTVKSESEFDERILARIYNADQNRHGNVNLRIDDMNRARRALREKERQEEIEELSDYSRFLVQTPKHRIQTGPNQFINL